MQPVTNKDRKQSVQNGEERKDEICEMCWRGFELRPHVYVMVAFKGQHQRREIFFLQGRVRIMVKPEK
jgi:hypothetical protein